MPDVIERVNHFIEWVTECIERNIGLIGRMTNHIERVPFCIERVTHFIEFMYREGDWLYWEGN